MKIAHIITKLELGGAQLNTIYTINYLIEKGFSVTLITGMNEVIPLSEINEKVKIIQLKELVREISIVDDYRCFIKLYQILKKEKFDIVHTHSSKAGILGRIAAKLAKTRLIFHTVHGWGFTPNQNKFTYYFFIFLEKICAYFTKKLIVVANNDIKKGLNYNIGNFNKYKVIRSGIDIDFFSKVNSLKEEVSKKYELPAGKIFITTISCFKPQKNLLEFIEIAKLLLQKNPDFFFVVIGDGEQKSILLNKLKKYDMIKYFKFTGWISSVREILYLTDIFLLTSLWEGLPRSVLESYAQKKVVVATNVDGTPEVVLNNKTGFTYSPGQINEAVEKIFYLSEHPEVMKKYGENGFDYINKEFSIKKMLQDILNLYKEYQ